MAKVVSHLFSTLTVRAEPGGIANTVSYGKELVLHLFSSQHCESYLCILFHYLLSNRHETLVSVCLSVVRMYSFTGSYSLQYIGSVQWFRSRPLFEFTGSGK
jgi:hypothetical protein